MTDPVQIIPGPSPVVLAQPHSATELGDTAHTLNACGLALADTDWHIDRLYDGLLPGANVVQAGLSRYVIDLNRDPEGGSLYPGQNTTGLCPLTDFDGNPIHKEGMTPDAAEIARRVSRVHAPYHAALVERLDRARAAHGAAILYDCHSIRSEIPRLFEARLPDLNIGTFNGASCGPAVTALLEDWRREAEDAGFTTVMNGRFKGGWTTRHYGRLSQNIHAVQMEIAQRAYMDETPPWNWREDRAATLRPLLKALLERLEALALSGGLEGDAP